jgi:hypothetical protein
MKKLLPVLFKRSIFLSFFLVAAVALCAADDSKPVVLSDTPLAVQKTINTQVGDGIPGGIFRSDENGTTTFDATFTAKTGGEHGFTVASDGTLLSVEVGQADTPPAVQKTIQAQAAGWDVEGIDKIVTDATPSFDVEIIKDGVERSFTVADDGTLSSIEVALADTPAAVQKTILAQTGWQVDGIDKSTDESGTTFDVDVSSGGVKKSFSVADDGYLLSVEVAFNATPAPVQAAIQKQVPGGVLKSIDENLDPAGNSFDVVAVAKDGGRQAFSVGADGTLLTQEVTLDQTTPAAHATIVKQLGDGTLKSIDESFDPPVNTFDVVAVMKDGSTKSFTIGAGGWMRSEEVTLDQTTPPARNTIQARIGDGKIVRIDKAWAEKKEDGVVPSEVQGRKDGQPFNFSVGPKGKFLGMDD